MRRKEHVSVLSLSYQGPNIEKNERKYETYLGEKVGEIEEK
jgi:hypothetical protein